MASRLFKQFFYTLFNMPVLLAGSAVWNNEVAASLVLQDLTYTADNAGENGNDISIEYTGGAVAGAEVVTVVGNAISVQIADGVSTATQIKTAVDASVAAATLVGVAVSGTGTNAQSITVATSLAGGENNEWQSLDFKGVSSIGVNGVGDYTLELQDKYQKLLNFNMKLLSTTSQDRHAQLDDDSVSSSGILGVKLLAATTPTHPVDGTKAFFEILLSNSSQD
jgi:hypothetical protein